MATAAEPKAEKKDKRPSTAHLKVVPETRELRDRVRAEAAALRPDPRPLQAAHPSRPAADGRGPAPADGPGRAVPRLHHGLPSANEFWREQVQAIDFKRRLLLLPHCLKNAEGCPADYDEFGLDCQKCGACSVADFKTKAEDLGYKVLVSEGTPIVLKIIVSGHVDAIVGVACLNVLEKALDKILLAGIPCVAAPLLSSNCRSTSVDDDWVSELIDLHTPPPPTQDEDLRPPDAGGAPALRGAGTEPAGAAARGGKAGTNGKPADPLALHENIAYDWLAQGGKRSRPFITLAAYDALKGAPGTRRPTASTLPDAVRRTALAIEAFHKASLVHDDIEDDDTFRYGRETLHRQYGVGTAINVGDYLLGLGYRLVSRERKELGGDCAADILNRWPTPT